MAEVRVCTHCGIVIVRVVDRWAGALSRSSGCRRSPAGQHEPPNSRASVAGNSEVPAEAHTVDVGHVHVLTAPGGPCAPTCPHPHHRTEETPDA